PTIYTLSLHDALPISNMPWYEGPSLLEYLETVDIEDRAGDRPFRFPVQWINRPDLDFRGFSGTVVAGSIAPGDPVVVMGSGRQRSEEHTSELQSPYDL